MPFERARRGAAGLSLALAACAAHPAPATATAQAADATTGQVCAPIARQPDGQCCGPDQFFDSAAGHCAAAGVAGCGLGVAADATACTVAWCFAWRSPADQPCSGDASLACRPVAVACTSGVDQAQCPVGQWPGGPARACVAAGGPDASAAWTTAATALPALAAVNAPADSYFCSAAATGDVTLCAAGEGSCPAGTVPSASAGQPCVPLGVPWLCPPGFAVDLAQAVTPPALQRCVPDPAACGTDPYGGVADGPNAVFVDATAPATGFGTRASPLATIQAALAVVPAGGTIALAAGTYLADVGLNKPLTLRGRCAALVKLDGGSVNTAVRFSHQTGLVTLRDVTIVGARGGIFHQGAGSAVVQGVAVQDMRFAGLAVHAQGALTIRDAVVGPHAVQVEATAMGVLVEAGSQVTLQRVRIQGATGLGLLAHDAATQLVATELLIDGGTPAAAATAGRGVAIEVGDGVQLVATSVRLSGNRSGGVVAFDPTTRVTARGLLVDNTLATQGSGELGRGIEVAGATLELQGAVVTANHDTGISVRQPTGRMAAHGLIIDHTAPRLSDGSGGQGCVVLQGGGVVGSSVRLSANHTTGLLVGGAGSSGQFAGLTVDRTTAAKPSGPFGLGAEVFAAGTLRIVGGRMHANHEAALVAEGGAKAEVVGLLVDGTLASLDVAKFGMGLEAAGEGALTVAGSRASANHSAGLVAIEAKAQLSATGVRVDGTLPVGGSVEGQFGVGLVVFRAAAVLLSRCQLDNNAAMGIYVSEGPLTLQQSIVVATQPGLFPRMSSAGLPTGQQVTLADGIVLARPTAALVDHCSVRGHARACILADGGALQLTGSVATQCHFGMAAQHGAAITQAGSVVYGNETNQSGDSGLAVPAAPDLVAGQGN